MSDKKTPQAGEWWETCRRKDKELVFIVGIKTCGHVIYETKDGYHTNGFSNWKGWHHLPDCTGWDWEPETFPQYWTANNNNNAYLKRIDEHHFIAARKDGTFGDLCFWTQAKTLLHVKITEAEALALLDKPEPPKTRTVTFYEYVMECEEYSAIGWRIDPPLLGYWTRIHATGNTREIELPIESAKAKS